MPLITGRHSLLRIKHHSIRIGIGRMCVKYRFQHIHHDKFVSVRNHFLRPVAPRDLRITQVLLRIERNDIANHISKLYEVRLFRVFWNCVFDQSIYLLSVSSTKFRGNKIQPLNKSCCTAHLSHPALIRYDYELCVLSGGAFL